MELKQQTIREADRKMRLDEKAVCDVCEKFGAYRFGDRILCEDCYQGGSCCPEFGKDDLWKFDDDP